MTSDLRSRDTVVMLNEVHAWFIHECGEPNPMTGEVIELSARRPFAMLSVAIASIMCRREALISEFVAGLNDDEDHKAWLREAADAWVTGNPIPPARSKSYPATTLLGKIATALGLLSSGIKSGVLWDDECERAKNEAFDALSKIGPLIPPSGDLPMIGSSGFKKGDRARFLGAIGNEREIAEAEHIFDKAKTYVVEFANVSKWRTGIKFEGVLGFFNSVMFGKLIEGKEFGPFAGYGAAGTNEYHIPKAEADAILASYEATITKLKEENEVIGKALAEARKVAEWALGGRDGASIEAKPMPSVEDGPTLRADIQDGKKLHARETLIEPKGD